jgi:hypothetical protein
MKFLLLLYGDESAWANMSPEDMQRSMEAYEAFGRELTESGAWVAGEGLEPTSTATVLRFENGQPLLTDGPYAETREQLGGFYLLECKDRDEAIAWAKKVPDADQGATEIRAAMDYEGF